MDTPTTLPVLPAGAVDTHVHVFDPARFAFAEQRTYTPGPAVLDDLRARHASLGVARAVLVQPSVYGTDNRCLVEALRRGGNARMRGIAVVEPASVMDRELDALHADGVRGVRLNLEVRHAQDPAQLLDQLAQACACIRQPGWHVQLHVSADLLGAVETVVDGLQVPLVLDHFGGLSARDGTGLSGRLDTLLRLLATGQVYVKLSAFYRASEQAPEHADLSPLARRLFAARPDRLLWGSDWPHTGGGNGPRDPDRIEPFRKVDLARSLDALQAWAQDKGTLHQILVANPAALYGFAEAKPSLPPVKESP